MSARPLRIAAWYNLPTGGAKRALYNHLAGLKARGHSIESFRPPVKDIGFMPIADVSEKEHEFPWADWHTEGRSYASKLLLAGKEVFAYVKSATDHAKLAAEEIGKGNFDVLFANTDMQFHAPHIGRFVDLPKVLYLQEPNRILYEPLPRLPWIAEDPSPATGLEKIKAQGRHWLNVRTAAICAWEELENAKAFDKILVNSFFSREAVLRAYGLNAKVCYLGVDPGMFRNLGLPRENFVIGVGTLGPTKNVLLAIEAVSRVPVSKRPKLVWVANLKDDDYAAACVTRSAELGVAFEPRILIPDAELVSLLNRALAMVYSPRLEPFGFAPLEANLCGLAVVAVAEGGVRETVVDGLNGLLVDHDAEQFSQAIIRVIDDAELRLRLGRQGEERALRVWGLEAAVDRLEAELYGVLSA